MPHSKLVFWKALTIVTTIFLSVFIWERISPVGFDVHFKVYKQSSPEGVLLDINTILPDFYFKDYGTLRGLLIGAWDSTITPLPEENINFSSELQFQLAGQGDRENSDTVEPGLKLYSYVGAALMGKPTESKVVSGLKLDNLYNSSPDGLVEILPASISLEWVGYLKIEKPGEYYFSLDSDDGAALFIDNELLISSSVYDVPKISQNKIYLSEGLHPFSLKYYNGASGGYLDLKWALPDSSGATELNRFSHIPDTNFQYGAEEERVEVRKNIKGDVFNYSKKQPNHYTARTWEGKINSIKFDTAEDILNGGLFKRLSDGTYQKASMFSFLRPSSKLNFLTSICLSIALSILSSTLFYFLIQRFINNIPILYSLNFVNTVMIASLARLNNLSTVPEFKYTSDEFLDTWIGLNLILIGRPSAWSWVGHVKSYQWIGYLGEMITYADYQFHPPPLFGLIVGTWLRLFGVESIYQFPLFLTRFPSFFVSILTLIVLIHLVNKVFSKESAILAGLFLGLFPANVALNSIVKGDNLLCLIALVSILLLVQKGPYTVTRYVSLALCIILSILTKEVGIFVPLAIGCYAIQNKLYKVLASASAGVVLGYSLYLLYAYCYSWENFIYSMKAIEAEGPSLISIIKVSLKQTLYGLSPFVHIGWLGLLYISQKSKNIFLIFAVSYVIIYGVIALGNYYYPWHQILLFPYLAIGGSICLIHVLFKPRNGFSSMIRAVFIFTILLPLLSKNHYISLNDFTLLTRRLIMVGLGSILISCIVFFPRLPKFLLPFYYFVILLATFIPFIYTLLFINYV